MVCDFKGKVPSFFVLITNNTLFSGPEFRTLVNIFSILVCLLLRFDGALLCVPVSEKNGVFVVCLFIMQD